MISYTHASLDFNINLECNTESHVQLTIVSHSNHLHIYSMGTSDERTNVFVKSWKEIIIKNFVHQKFSFVVHTHVSVDH